MLNQSGIYQILNTVNNKRYIGSAICFRTRWNQHRRNLKNKKHHSKYLQASWNKYGEENFKFEVLLTCVKEDLIANEQRQINWYKPEYNMCPTAGSSLGRKHSKEAIDKVKVSLIGNKRALGHVHSEETIKRMSDSTKTQIRKPHSEESKNKMSKSSTGKRHSAESILKMREIKLNVSEETRKKYSLGQLGRKHTEETRKLMSEQAKGNKRNLGRKQSPETIAKRVATRKRNKETKALLQVSI